MSNYIESKAKPLKNASDLNSLIDASSTARLVLLGEASHGTHEYYVWRDNISRRLIKEHGFSFIAVEGDWASLYELNRYVKNMPGAAKTARDVLKKLDRFPVWMWANEEVVSMAEWLRKHNDKLPQHKKVGFYGMDVYDEWRSNELLLSSLKEVSVELYDSILRFYNCITPYKPDSWRYARAVASSDVLCSDELLKAVEILQNNREKLHISDYEYFYIMQNALVVKHAEKFYRKSYMSKDASGWNSRVRYMDLTVNNLLELYGDKSKGIVWAHNTHIGDAQYTEMHYWQQENIGKLSRQKHGKENVFLIGFGTYQGSVKAANQWGATMRKMEVPKAAPDSHEEILAAVPLHAYYLIFDEDARKHKELNEARGNRAIGVVYNPVTDHSRNYVRTVLPMRYDAFIFFRETKALSPLK